MPLVLFGDLSGCHSFRFVVGFRCPLLREANLPDCTEQGFSFDWFPAGFSCLVLELNDPKQSIFLRFWFYLNALGPFDRPCFPIDLGIDLLKKWKSQDRPILS